MKEIVFVARDKKQIFCSLWDNTNAPIGIVVIIHGMNDYANRYDDFAKFLNQNRYIVFGADNRAHGRTTKQNKWGTTDGSIDIFADTVNDYVDMIKILNDTYNLPIFIIGYDYGSFITQGVLEKTKLCMGGICMMGTAKFSKTILWFARFVAWVSMKIYGPDRHIKFLKMLLPTNSMQRQKSKYRKIKIYSKNQNDIKDYSSGFYYSLFKNLVEVDYKICPETPLLILSSGQDINGIHCRLAKTLYNAYSIYDLHKITLIIYPDAQHDLLFGLEKNKVQNDILDFINKHV